MATKAKTKNWYYQAKDWKCYETIIMVEGPSTPLMLHIASIKYVIEGVSLDYDGIIALYPFVTLPWPDRRLFDMSWPSIREDIRLSDARVVAARENGKEGGRPTGSVKVEGSGNQWIAAIAEALRSYEGLLNRRVKKVEVEDVTKFFENHHNPKGVVDAYVRYLNQMVSSYSLPVSFYKWLRTISDYKGTVDITINQIHRSNENEDGSLRCTAFDDEDL